MSGAGFTAADAQRWIPRLRRYALALTGSRDAADDLTQDTLERAWRKRALWQPGTDLRAWLFSVMHNVWVNGTRSVRPMLSLDGDAAVADVLQESSAPATADGGIVLAELQQALLRLPDEQRAVLLLVGLEQLSYAEAAAVLEVPIGTVMSRLARGREQLRRLLAPETNAATLRRVK